MAHSAKLAAATIQSDNCRTRRFPNMTWTASQQGAINPPSRAVEVCDGVGAGDAHRVWSSRRGASSRILFEFRDGVRARSPDWLFPLDVQREVPVGFSGLFDIDLELRIFGILVGVVVQVHQSVRAPYAFPPLRGHQAWSQ